MEKYGSTAYNNSNLGAEEMVLPSCWCCLLISCPGPPRHAAGDWEGQGHHWQSHPHPEGCAWTQREVCTSNHDMLLKLNNTLIMMWFTTQNTLCWKLVLNHWSSAFVTLGHFGGSTHRGQFSRCDHCLLCAGITSSDWEVLWPSSRRCGEVIAVWGIIELWVYFNVIAVYFAQGHRSCSFFGNRFISWVAPVLTSPSLNLSTSVTDAVWLLAPSGCLQVAEILH